MARMDWNWDSLPPPCPGATVSQSQILRQSTHSSNITSIHIQSYPHAAPQLESVEVARVDFLEAHVPDHSAVFHYLVLLQLQVATVF